MTRLFGQGLQTIVANHGCKITVASLGQLSKLDSIEIPARPRFPFLQIRSFIEEAAFDRS